jgi:hypothetical protein
MAPAAFGGKGPVTGSGLVTVEQSDAGNFPFAPQSPVAKLPSAPKPSLKTYQDPTTPAALPLT